MFLFLYQNFLFLFLAVACPHFFRAWLAAEGTVVLREKTAAVGTFIEIGAVELLGVGEGASE